MMQTIKEYAEALYALAFEEDIMKEVAESVNSADEVFSENPQYLQLLYSPAVPLTERLELIEQAFGGSIHEHVLSLLKLLCEKGRIIAFRECGAEFNKLLDFANRVSTARVTCAIELTDTERENLTAKLEKLCGHTVLIEDTVDEALLGGMIIEVDGRIIDASLRNRLNVVKDVMGR